MRIGDSVKGSPAFFDDYKNSLAKEIRHVAVAATKPSTDDSDL